MSCATGAATTGEAVDAVSGVFDVDVNAATDEARVEYNPAEASLEDVYAAIDDAGFEPITDESDGALPDAMDGVADEPGSHESAATRELVHQRRLVLAGGLLTLPFWFLMGDMVGLYTVPETVAGVNLGWIQFAIATTLMATLGREFVAGAWRAWQNGHDVNMDTLVAVGTTAGYGFSTAVLVSPLVGAPLVGDLYFEAVAFILWFITVGNWLEARSKARASDALRELLRLRADAATIVDDDGTERTVPV